MTVGDRRRLQRWTPAIAALLSLLVGCSGTDRELTAEERWAKAISDGYVALCNDGNFSNNTDFNKTCSGGDGLDEWLGKFGQCQDGTIIVMRSSASCSGKGGFGQVMEAGYKPEPGPDHVALCNDGNFSNNTDFDKTCSGGDGIDHWLAEYGECTDGTTIRMATSASCSGHGGFKGLKATDYVPEPNDDDVALCNDGNFSDNTDFYATCSGGGGIDRWLAEYVECTDGTIVRLEASASCGDAEFKERKPDGYVPPPTTTTTTPTVVTVPETTSSIVQFVPQTTVPPPPPTTAAPSVYYQGCDEARAAGAAPISQGEPGYRPELDRDHDGVACET